MASTNRMVYVSKMDASAGEKHDGEKAQSLRCVDLGTQHPRMNRIIFVDLPQHRWLPNAATLFGPCVAPVWPLSILRNIKTAQWMLF